MHELQVHQIELEMQNDELRQSWAEVEAGLERYTELYDFAPVGYLTLGRDGVIRQVNLTGARLMEAERVGLPGRRRLRRCGCLGYDGIRAGDMLYATFAEGKR